MATNILNLPVVTSVDGTEYVPVVQGSTTKRMATGLVMAGSSSVSTQSANTVLAGPSSGSAAAPSFRALVSDDLPTVPITKGGTGASSASAARTALGLAIGTDVQAYDADLTTLGAGGAAARALIAGWRAYATAAEINTDLAAGREVNIAGGTVSCSEQIVIPSGGILRLGGATLDFSGYSASAPMIECAGTAGAAVALASDAAAGQAAVVVASAASFSAGQMVRIYSAEVYDPNRTASLCGELAVIKSIVGTTLTMEAALSDGYAVADSAYVEPLTPVENILISGPGTIVGNATAQSTQDGVRFWRARNCHVEGIRFYDIDLAQIIFRDSMNCHATRNYYGRTQPNTTGYGVSFRDATQDCSSTHSTHRENRHAMTTNNSSSYGGIPRRCAFSDNVVVNSALSGGGAGGDAIDTHAAAEDIWIRRNSVRGASGQGINIENPSAVIEDNHIADCASNGIGVHNETPVTASIILRRNKIRDCGADGITITEGNAVGSVGYDRVVVEDNDVADCAEVGIEIGTSSASPAANVQIRGNTVERCSNASGAVIMTYGSGFVVDANRVQTYATGQNGIRLYDCQHGSIANNVVTMIASTTAPAIRIDATSTLDPATVVNGNTVKCTTPSSFGGLFIGSNAYGGVTIGANDFREAATPVSPVSTTIASDAITLQSMQSVQLLTIDTEGAAATDNLATINGGFGGMMLVLSTAGNARDVTVKNGTGNIRLNGADVTLDNTRDTITLVKSRGGDWLYVSSGNNGA